MGAIQRRDCSSLPERNFAKNDEDYGRKTWLQSIVRIYLLSSLCANGWLLLCRKNQYTAKIKDWGLEKYGNSTMWKHIGQKKEKRKLEGKDSLFEIRGRKRSRSYIERELSRNVTFTSQVQLLEDIPTPEGVRVFTPDAESSSIALRQVYTGNLPWLEFQRDVGIMMSKSPTLYLNAFSDFQ